ncbi:MAG: cystathionine gamma-synthase [Bacteroidetes bacterium]|nr:cystathionine gamma-synthase [Bacteroidota bacterium]MDA0943357.1 cystathionine gamma-synthase [Bacteroidota bacterium]MDA1111029.1 cystathionine gamma-synthase [Bacteroidota bacterium]
MNSKHIETQVLHTGIQPDPTTGAIMTPIFQTSTYVQAGPGDHKGYEYARTQNPTRDALQNNLAALEGASHGLCFSTGMGAVDACIKLLQPGDEVIATNDLYGGTYRIFTKVFEPLGIKFHFVDMSKPEEVRAKINDRTKMVWVETPTNPLLRIIDIEAVASIGHEVNAIVVVDNTFSSPYLQNPLKWGADLIMHSATKYINGHSDVVMGVLITDNDELHQRLAFLQNTCGATPGPQDCFLVLRGIKTLHIRMQRHCENGRAVAEFLAKHPKIGEVHWPGFEQHPNHAVAKKQMRDFGGMISFTLKDDDIDKAVTVLKSTQYFALAESLGGVESLIGHPATMTHASIPREQRMANGLKDSLIRLSVGIEHIDDLLADLSQALDRV